MNIRQANKADAGQMQLLARSSDLAAQWSGSAYEHIFDEPGRMAWVAESEAEVVGLLVVNTRSDVWEIENLVVRASERRRGIASQLLGSLTQIAQAGSTRQILLEVRESNADARALYRRFGYVEAGRRRGYYSCPQEDAVVLSLSLH